MIEIQRSGNVWGPERVHLGLHQVLGPQLTVPVQRSDLGKIGLI